MLLVRIDVVPGHYICCGRARGGVHELVWQKHTFRLRASNSSTGGSSDPRIMDSMSTSLRSGATGIWTSTHTGTMTPDECLASKRSFLKSKLKNLQITNSNSDPLMRIYYSRNTKNTVRTKFCKDYFDMIAGGPLHGFLSNQPVLFVPKNKSPSPVRFHQ